VCLLLEEEKEELVMLKDMEDIVGLFILFTA
jgi:hypothetical protein